MRLSILSLAFRIAKILLRFCTEVYLLSNFSLRRQQRVECLAGVEVTCTPPELSVKLRDKEQHKWTFTLSFKVSL